MIITATSVAVAVVTAYCLLTYYILIEFCHIKRI